MFINVLKVVKNEYDKNGRDVIWALAFIWVPLLCLALIGVSFVINYIVQNITNLFIGAVPAVIIGWLLVYINKRMDGESGNKIKSA